MIGLFVQKNVAVVESGHKRGRRELYIGTVAKEDTLVGLELALLE